MRESHSISPLMDGFDYFTSFEQCGGKSCYKNQLRSHFHCAQGNNCPAILTQYSAVATHKHGRGTPVIKTEEQDKQFEEAKDYSLKERASVDSVGSAKEPNESYTPTNFIIKSEFEREQDNVSGKCLQKYIKNREKACIICKKKMIVQKNIFSYIECVKIVTYARFF